MKMTFDLPHLIRSSRASAEVMTGPPPRRLLSISVPVPGLMMRTRTMPTTTAMKVVHR